MGPLRILGLVPHARAQRCPTRQGSRAPALETRAVRNTYRLSKTNTYIQRMNALRLAPEPDPPPRDSERA